VYFNVYTFNTSEYFFIKKLGINFINSGHVKHCLDYKAICDYTGFTGMYLICLLKNFFCAFFNMTHYCQVMLDILTVKKGVFKICKKGITKDKAVYTNKKSLLVRIALISEK
jgi:hypothetical protein